MNWNISYQSLYDKYECRRKIEVAHFKNNNGKCLVCNTFTSKQSAKTRTHLHEEHKWEISA